MSRLISTPFFSATPVFNRADYAAAIGRVAGDKVVTAMLAQHLKAGNIRRIARGRLRLGSQARRRRAPGRSIASSRPPACGRAASSPITPRSSCTAMPTPKASTCRSSRRASPGCWRPRTSPAASSKRPGALATADDVTTVDRLGQDGHGHDPGAHGRRPVRPAGPRRRRRGAVQLARSRSRGSTPPALARLFAASATPRRPARRAGGWSASSERLGVSDGASRAPQRWRRSQNRYALGAGPGAGRAAHRLERDPARRPCSTRFEGL